MFCLIGIADGLPVVAIGKKKLVAADDSATLGVSANAIEGMLLLVRFELLAVRVDMGRGAHASATKHDGQKMDIHPRAAARRSAPARLNRSATSLNRSAAAPLPVEEAFRRLLQRRKLLLTSFLLSLLAGVGAMLALQKSKHNYEGALLYSPNKVTAPYYIPPTLSNLVQIVDSPVLLNKLRDQFDLDDSLSTLKRNVKFELAPGGDTLVVRVIRADADESATVLNGAMQLFVEETRGLRKQALERFVDEFESNAVLGKKSVDESLAKLQSYLEANNLENPDGLKMTATSFQRSATQLEMELEMARIELASARAKRELLMATQADQAEYDEESVEDHPYPFAQGSLGHTDADRRLFLRDQIIEEQRTSSYAVKLEVKEREQKRAAALHAKGLISDAENERIDGELSILQSEKNTRVTRLTKQLGQVEQKLAKRFSNPRLGSSDAMLALSGFAEEPQLLKQSIALLELEILGAEHKVNGLTLKLKSKHAELEQIGQSRKEVEPLVKAVQIATSERDRLQHLVEEFRQAHRSDVDELKIVQTATPTIDGVRSNGNKILAASLMGTFGLLIAPVFFREWRKQASRGADSAARRLGVPVLADFDDGRDPEEVASLLALRLQRELPPGNAAVLFTGNGSSARQLSTPIAVAKAVAQRGDSVVFVELVDDALQRLTAEADLTTAKAPVHAGIVTGDHAAGTLSEAPTDSPGVPNGAEPKLGVADFLRGEAFDVDQLICVTKYPNLSRVSSGTTTLTGDLLISGKLGELFDQLKSDYAMVVVAGPGLDQRLHIECLSRCVEGVVVLCQDAPLDESAQRTAQDLIDADIPVLGVVA